MATSIARFPHDDDETWEFVATFLGIEIPRRAVCSTPAAPFTAFADAHWVAKGFTLPDAIAHVSKARPPSVETPEQEAALSDFAARRKGCV